MIILLVGVPASGKSYVCERMKLHYNVVCHDDYERGDYIRVLKAAAKGTRPVIAEAPFNAAALTAELINEGLEVQEWLVTAPLDAIKARYAARQGKEYPSNFETNWHRYEASSRFRFKGTSDAVIVALRARCGR